MKNMKLNALESQSLNNKEMNAVRGGDAKVKCTCACCYAGQPGGSSTNANSAANAKDGKKSPCESDTTIVTLDQPL
ncbi:MAG: TIGR04149 family rSAM-modified RiPP [Prevotellaceae bacterium]|jgi:natural product precursor|nr:TIGR04149 family rSAM-modified RiPP [Prevotellaceae bacterium]